MIVYNCPQCTGTGCTWCTPKSEDQPTGPTIPIPYSLYVPTPPVTASRVVTYDTTRDEPLSLRQWLQRSYDEHMLQASYFKRLMEDMDRG